MQNLQDFQGSPGRYHRNQLLFLHFVIDKAAPSSATLKGRDRFSEIVDEFCCFITLCFISCIISNLMEFETFNKRYATAFGCILLLEEEMFVHIFYALLS